MQNYIYGNDASATDVRLQISRPKIGEELGDYQYHVTIDHGARTFSETGSGATVEACQGEMQTFADDVASI